MVVGGSGGDNTIFAGTGGGDTLLGGGGGNTFHISAQGSDTIDGGSGGGNTVNFDNHADNADVSISTNGSGVTTVQFADTGQTFTVSHVQELVFDDNTHVNL